MRSASVLLREFNRLKAARANFENAWQEIADHGLGRRDFLSSRTPGEKRQQFIFDTTFQLSADLLSAALHALLTNPATQWFALRPENEALLEIPEVQEWIYEAEQDMLRVFENPKGGFATAMHEVYIDLPVFGTAGLWVEDDVGGNILFSARPLGEMFLSENAAGYVDTVYRRFPFTCRQAVQVWKDRAPEKAKQAVHNGKGEEKMTFLHAVQPSEGEGRPWDSQYLALEEGKMVDEGGFFSMPYMTPRWSKDTGETYGRGPGWTAIPEAKTLNEMSKDILQAAQLALRPPRMVPDDGCVFPLKLTPGAQNKYRAGLFQNDPIQTLGYEGNFPIGEKTFEMRQEAVRRAFHSELLPLFEKPYMTATEVIELANQAQRFLSPTHGRLQVELLEPAITRVFDIKLRMADGPFGQIPDVLRNTEIQVVYVSPIARAQKEQEVRAILESAATIGQLEAVYPGVSDNFDADEAAKKVLSLRAIPPAIRRSPRDVARMRAQRAEQEAAQAQMQSALATSQVAKNIAPAAQRMQ